MVPTPTRTSRRDVRYALASACRARVFFFAQHGSGGERGGMAARCRPELVRAPVWLVALTEHSAGRLTVKLSTKGRYAVMAMVDLATNSHGHPVALADIAERQEISLSYLEQLFAKLRRGGLVRSVRGPAA